MAVWGQGGRDRTKPFETVRQRVAQKEEVAYAFEYGMRYLKKSVLR